MKILYVAHKTPYPVLDGGCFAMKQFIEVLVDSAICDAFILETHKHPIVDASKKYLDVRFRNIYSDYLHTEVTFSGMLKGLFSKESYLLSRFQSQELNSFLKKHSAEYDYIVCDSLFALYACRTALNSNTKIVLRSHNIEFKVWSTLADSTKGWKKPLYRILAKQLKQEELKLLSQIDLNFAISSEDLQEFKRLLPNKKQLLFPIHLAPVAVRTDYSVNSACFIGSLNWKPNQESVSYLLRVWKAVELTGIALHIAGSFGEFLKGKTLPTGVNYLGKVASAEEFIIENGFLAAPILSGGGIKVKILEALASGTPCITTPIGAQGLDSKESGILIVANQQEFQQAVLALSQSEDQRKELGAKGKAYIQKYHSFAACKELITVNLGR